jgi:hypothetical protein
MADVQLSYTATQIDNVLDRHVETGFIHAYIASAHTQEIAGSAERIEAVLVDDECCFTITTGRLTYTGTPTRTFMGVGSFSIKTSTLDTTVTIVLYKNGVEVPGTRLARKLSTSGDVGAITGNAIVAMSTNDYFEVWAFADKTTDVTFDSFQLSFLGV